MEKNNNKACGICGKWFASGKAIGGNMKAHLIPLPIPPTLETNNQATDSSTNRPKRNFSAFSANSNRENKSVSNLKIPNRKKSKCLHKLNARADTKDLQVQTSSEEVVIALCIIKSKEKMKGDSLAQAYSQAMFKCERCGKLFRSYQALGGHKAGHSKTAKLRIQTKVVVTLGRSKFKD